MEQLFEPAEIRTTLPLISLARRDFERCAPSDKPPRINQAAGVPPPPPSPPTPRRSPALPCYWPTPSLSSCSRSAVGTPLSANRVRATVAHTENPSPPRHPPYFCRAAAAAAEVAVADYDMTVFMLDCRLQKYFIERCCLLNTKKITIS